MSFSSNVNLAVNKFHYLSTLKKVESFIKWSVFFCTHLNDVAYSQLQDLGMIVILRSYASINFMFCWDRTEDIKVRSVTSSLMITLLFVLTSDYKSLYYLRSYMSFGWKSWHPSSMWWQESNLGPFDLEPPAFTTRSRLLTLARIKISSVYLYTYSEIIK